MITSRPLLGVRLFVHEREDMGQISTVTVYESRAKVRDALLGIIQNLYSRVHNLDESGGQVRIDSCLVKEPSYEGEALRIIVNGQLNSAAVNKLIAFELTGDDAVHVVADYLEGERILERYVSLVLEELKPVAMGPASKSAEPQTPKSLSAKWKTMKPATRQKYVEASRHYKRMYKEYERAVLDGNSEAPKPTIQDFRTRVLATMHWDVGDRTLRQVLQMMEAGLIK